MAFLALFHGQLLWQRIASFTLFEPQVALRWGSAALLLAAFLYLHRAGISLVRGHKALILWLLVLLCHAGTVVSIGDHQPLAEPGLLLALSFWGFALRAIFGESRRLIGDLTPLAQVAADRRPSLPCGPGVFEPLSPRPPPIG